MPQISKNITYLVYTFPSPQKIKDNYSTVPDDIVFMKIKCRSTYSISIEITIYSLQLVKSNLKKIPES